MIHMTKTQRAALVEELGELGKYSKAAHALRRKLQSSRTVNRTVIQDAMMRASTTRNTLLITDTEQRKLASATVGFFGLSVGSHAALTWMMLSRAKDIKIADPDIISPSNLNRLRLGWSTIGKRKMSIIKKDLLDMHPAARVHTLITTDSVHMETFCTSVPTVDCIVDEIDDLEGKVLLRKFARDLRVPLISAVDVGDNVFIDIERYDTQPNTKFFLGRIPDIECIELASLTHAQKARFIISLVGLEHNSVAMLASLLAIGKKIGTWPQLGSTATIAGGIVASTIKRIVLGERIQSGRYVFDMDALLGKSMRRAELAMRQSYTRRIQKKFDM